MAVNKNFVVKNGIEVSTDLLVGSVDNSSVGIGTTLGRVLLDVRGAIGATHLSVSGVGTVVTLNSTNFTGTAGTITTLTSTDSTITNGTITNLTGTAGTITNGTITNLTGTAGTITTLTSTGATITNGTITNLTGIAATITNLNSTDGVITNLSGTIGTITTFSAVNGTIISLTGTAGTITTIDSINITATDGTITNLTGTAGTITTLTSTNGTITNGTVTNLTGTAGTITTLTSTNGNITNLTGTGATITNGTITNLTGTAGTITNGTVTNLTGTAGTITTLTSTNVTITNGTITNLTGTAGTITNGAITNLIGTAATITTIEATNGSITNFTPTNINASGVITATSFYGDGSNLSNVGGYWVQNDAGIHTTGSVGVGTTNPNSVVPSDNTAILNVGILTAYKLYGDGSSITNLPGSPNIQITLDTGNTSTTGMSITGVSTFTTAEVTNLLPTNINSSGVTTVTTLDVQTKFDVYDSEAVFHNDVYVAGNLSIGGTTVTFGVENLVISDKDLIVGYTTNASNDDVSTDNTANHGGIAVASTEGSPLVPFKVAGINTLPDTYKQWMWVKGDTFGVGTTDAWMSNYAVGVGSTLVPTGVVFAAGGIQFTDTTATINTVNATNGTITNLTGTAGTITTLTSTNGTITNLTGTAGTITNFTPTNINASGIVTATAFVGDGSGLTGAGSTVADDTTTNETFYPVFTQTTSGTITASKVSTTKLFFNPSSGILSATAYYGDGSNLTGAGSTVADDTTTNETFYPLFTQSTSGSVSATKVSTTKFTFNPSTGEAAATNFNSTSDESLKTNIHTVENSLDIVDQLRGVSFDWKENGKSSYGVIAQELEQVLPELVAQTDPKSVNYNGIIGILIEAIKELREEIREFKSTK